MAKKRKRCDGCIYRRPIGPLGTLAVCHYMYDTGNPRGCPPEKCDKKKTAEGGK